MEAKPHSKTRRLPCGAHLPVTQFCLIWSSHGNARDAHNAGSPDPRPIYASPKKLRPIRPRGRPPPHRLCPLHLRPPMPSHADAPEPIIPGYIIERLLRTGGSASVYAAVHLHTGRRVALKVLRKEPAKKGCDSSPSHPRSAPVLKAVPFCRFLEGMRREATALQLLRHINIVLAEIYFETDDYACLAMQLASGGAAPLTQTPPIPPRLTAAHLGDLLDHINEHGPLSEAQIKRVLLQVLAGLSHAHNQGVAHLDLKVPSPHPHDCSAGRIPFPIRRMNFRDRRALAPDAAANTDHRLIAPTLTPRAA